MKETLFLFFVCSVMCIQAQNARWTAPEYTKNTKNPALQDDYEFSLEEGKYIFLKHCIPCHGKYGLGDGKKGLKYFPRPANLTSDRVQNQKDGEIYWKISHGRNKMLSFKHILTDENKWFLVNYIRTLAE